MAVGYFALLFVPILVVRTAIRIKNEGITVNPFIRKAILKGAMMLGW